MVDPQSVVLGLSGAAKLLQTLKNLVTTADAREELSKLYDVIITAQGNAFEMDIQKRAMADEIRTLEEKILQFEAWQREKLRYAMDPIGPGVFAYALKKEAAGAEPPHWICPNCYAQGKKSLLQHNGSALTRESALVCQACKGKLQSTNYLPQPRYAE